MRYYASSQTILHRGEGEEGGELFQNTGTLVMMEKCNFSLSCQQLRSFSEFLGHQKQRTSKQTDRSRQALQVI